MSSAELEYHTKEGVLIFSYHLEIWSVHKKKRKKKEMSQKLAPYVPLYYTMDKIYRNISKF